MRNANLVGAICLTLASLGCGDDGGGTGGKGDAAAADAKMKNFGKCGDSKCVLTNEGSTMFANIRVGEHGIPNLMADILLTAAAADSKETLDIAFINAGAIRAGFVDDKFMFTSEDGRIGAKFSSDLTEDDLKRWFPFPNGASNMTLNGAQIKRSLESGVRAWKDDAGLQFGPDLNNDKGGELLQVAGMSYEVTCAGTTRMVIGPADCNPFDALKPCSYQNPYEADSITKITVGTTVIYDKSQGGWVDRGDTKEYRVTMSSFIADGLDNHLDFKDGKDRKDLEGNPWPFQEAIVDYFLANSPVTLNHNQNRIVVKGNCNLPSSCVPSQIDHENCQHL